MLPRRTHTIRKLFPPKKIVYRLARVSAYQFNSNVLPLSQSKIVFSLLFIYNFHKNIHTHIPLFVISHFHSLKFSHFHTVYLNAYTDATLHNGLISCHTMHSNFLGLSMNFGKLILWNSSFAVYNAQQI